MERVGRPRRRRVAFAALFVAAATGGVLLAGLGSVAQGVIRHDTTKPPHGGGDATTTNGGEPVADCPAGQARDNTGTCVDTTPATPPPPPVDPLTPPTTAPNTSITPEMKKEGGITLAQLRSILVGTATFLGDCLTPTDNTTDTTDPVLCFVAAQSIITEALAEYKKFKDPPDPNFMQVALGVPASVPPGGFKCPRKAKKIDCAAVTAALRKYLAALNVNAQASWAGAVTLERFSGAVQAKSVPGALLQAAAEKAYAGLIVSTKAAQQAAGVTLGLTLRRTHLERTPTKSRFQAHLKKLSTAKGLPAPLIARLIAGKQIASAADLDPILQGVVGPYVSFSRAVILPVPSTGSAALWHTITVKDLALLIRGLVAQNAVQTSLGNPLLDELRAIVNAPSAEARKPLIAKLVTDASAVAGPAGILLAAGASGLS